MINKNGLTSFIPHVVAKLKMFTQLIHGGKTKALAIKGSLWIIIGQIASHVLRLGSNIVLSRLLFPEAFGVMALVSVFNQGLLMFSDLGLGPSIIKSQRGENEVFLNTAWTVQIIRGTILWIVCCLLAYPFAQFYNAPILISMLPFVSLDVVIRSFQSTAIFTAHRHLKMGRLTIIELVGLLVGIITMITYAMINPTIWALGFGVLANSIVQVILGYVLLPSHRHRITFEKEAWNEIYTFGKWIFISSILTFLATQADKLILGKLTSPAVFGVYSIAFNIGILSNKFLQPIGNKIIFPVFSESVRTSAFEDNLLRKVSQPLVLFGALITSMVIASGVPLIEGLYDERYQAAGWMLSIISVGIFFTMLSTILRGALLAIGRSKDVTIGNFIKFVSLIIVLPIGNYYAGILGILIAIIGTEIVKYLSLIYSLQKVGFHVLNRDMLLFITVIISSTLGLLTVWGVNNMERAMNGLLLAIIAIAISFISFNVVAFLLGLFNIDLNNKMPVESTEES